MTLEQRFVSCTVQSLTVKIEQYFRINCFAQAMLCFILQIITSMVYIIWLIKIEDKTLILPLCILFHGLYNFKHVKKCETKRRSEVVLNKKNSRLFDTLRTAYPLMFIPTVCMCIGSIYFTGTVRPLTWFVIPLIFGYIGETLSACTPIKFKK